MTRVGWKRKHKKGYWIYHFYFYLSTFDWWSVHYKVRGNKRVRPEKLILRDHKKEDANYYPYNLSEDLMDGWVEVGEKRFEVIMKELEKRDKLRRENLERLSSLLENARREV
jgi:hypothetical protein